MQRQTPVTAYLKVSSYCCLSLHDTSLHSMINTWINSMMKACYQGLITSYQECKFALINHWNDINTPDLTAEIMEIEWTRKA